MLGSVIIGVGTGSLAAGAALIIGASWLEVFSIYTIAGTCGLLGCAILLFVCDRSGMAGAGNDPEETSRPPVPDTWLAKTGG